MSRYASIISSGRYIPPIERSNAEMAATFGEVIGKFEGSTGITRRFFAPDDWVTSDLATEACKNALDKAGLKPEDLDMIILGTDSPDYITPATSVVVQHKLGATRAGTFDIGCACASFPTGLNLASGAGVAFNNHLAVLLITTNQHRAAAYPHSGMFMDMDTRAVLAPLTNAFGSILAPANMVNWWTADGNANDIFGTNNATPCN